MYEDNEQKYSTQGGGVVEWDELCLGYRFLIAPKGYNVGDVMPDYWSLGGTVKD